MNKINFFLVQVLLLLSLKSLAQPLTAYYNFQNQFFAWNNGMTEKIDYLVPQDFGIGRAAIPFIDNARNFMIFSPKSGVQKINNGFTNSFWVSDNIIAYQNAKVLNVWENGETHTLSNLCSDFYVGDSVVMFYDRIKSQYCIYYNHEISVLEDYLSSVDPSTLFGEKQPRKLLDNQDVAMGQIPSIAVSDNIAAYINFQNRFMVFHNGNLVEQEKFPIRTFGVGRNIASYVNQNMEFKAYYNGATVEIDAMAPISYQVGDNLIAFISSDNYFKIWYNGTLYNIGYFDADYKVVDNIVYYEDQSGYFHIFFKGKDYAVESYMPEGIVAHYNSVAYISRSRMIKMFTEGETFDVVNADVAFWRLDYDVIQYRFGANLNKVFYKGKTY